MANSTWQRAVPLVVLLWPVTAGADEAITVHKRSRLEEGGAFVVREVVETWQPRQTAKCLRSGLLQRSGLPRSENIFAEQRPQRRKTQPTTARVQEPAASDELNVFTSRIHNHSPEISECVVGDRRSC